MATRNINEYLESGEVNDVKKGGTNPGDSLQELDEVQTAIAAVTDPLDVRLFDLEDGHTIVLNATSLDASQEPTGLGVPLQITLGAAQGTSSDPVMIDATGAITFNTEDKYIVNFRAHYGRVGGAGVSILMFRFLKNGTQIGPAYATKVDNADVLIPWDSSSFILNAAVGDILTAQIIRDSNGNDSGGLFAHTSADGWGTAPCVAVSVYKV